ncbi:Rmd8p [Kluyveromyces lactis]|uniref:KLLA0A00715p n=1 Tax=Kluyveromyces lactis (strain ATCC 8585 / CBS 2359 / DSM 70799 / NBRC 1267 / NRRL Y-1140 / WM37) TaxID=284590 RepID=Q6CYF9_KLULA|nr:uncharacterized protein KLLA0_A00715g [Kluyveromyces lactis]CAH02618.1 KLLA0A00715p [Kluyveromyces lactis]|eukprot:XP_451030.1 uncharacterized protein KLLA0_A00715g [Kluyveromyces lactis]
MSVIDDRNTAVPMSRSLSRRSPSILVTDARSNKNRPSAPFAGHAAGMRNVSSVPRSAASSGGKTDSKGSRVRRRGYDMHGDKKSISSRFSDVSMDNLLLDVSDVPSGRRQERLSTSSYDMFPRNRQRGTHITKMINPLPTRTSKTSQKLVLIPDEAHDSRNINQFRKRANKTQRAKSSSKTKMDKEVDLPRITAYNVAEGFNLSLTSTFMKQTHDVLPRLYDECLYVPYTLPLLPGKDGFRIKSNISKKTQGGKSIIDYLIDTSERRDHHYEYFSGVETLEDVNNNYELDEGGVTNNLNAENTPDHLPNPPVNTSVSFDPSEPQYFAEENNAEAELEAFNEINGKTSLFQQQHAEIFIFSYGVVVFWNFTEIQEKNILGDISFSSYKNMVLKPLDEQDIEIESFHFEYDMDTERPRIFNDIVTLRSGDHLTALTLSHAIAQSVKLSRFEARIVPIFGSVSKLPKRLALYGTLGLKREQLLKKSGKLFKLRVDVNLSSSVLDTPEFFWSFEPSLHSLYQAMREYLEIDPRVQVLNDRCKVFLEFFDICVDSIAERNMARITWWFITIIFISVLISIVEILVRYFIIKKHTGT